VGESVATIVTSRWEHQLDRVEHKYAIARPIALGEELEVH